MKALLGHGVGKNLKWVLEPQNAEIRSKLREAYLGGNIYFCPECQLLGWRQ